MNSLKKIYKHIRFHNSTFVDITLSKDTEEYLESWFKKNPDNYVRVWIEDREKTKDGYITLWKCGFTEAIQIKTALRLSGHDYICYEHATDFDIDNAIYIAYMNAICGVVKKK